MEILLSLPYFTLGPILAYMVFANLKVFSLNFVNFQDILLKFSEGLYYVLHLNFLSTVLIKCKERHKLDVFFQTMVLGYILMGINYR